MKGCSVGIVGVLIGLALIGVGVIVGNSTYQNSYQQVKSQTLQLYVSGDASDGYISYIELKGTSAIYEIHEQDFVPQLNYAALGGDQTLSLTFIPDNTSQVDITTSDGLEIKGTGYQVVALTALEGNQARQFATADYTANPGGYQENRWSVGRWFVGIGIGELLLIVFIVLLMNGILIYPTFG